MLALLQRRRGHSNVVPQDPMGAVAHQETGFGAPVEGKGKGKRLLAGLYPPISKGPGLTDGTGELLQLLPKAKALGHTKEGRQEGHLAGHGSQGPAGDPGGRGQKAVVGPNGGVDFSKRTVLTRPNNLGLLRGGTGLKPTDSGRALGSLLGNVGGGRRADGALEEPETQRSDKKGGSVAEAIRISRLGTFQKKVALFRNRFFAASSTRARACKRAEVLKLAKSVKGSDNVLPLSKETVEAVAAALKESGMKSGSQYLVELRLMHIEAGHEVEAWLKRTFDLCKKALDRLRGPTIRAAEVKIATWDEEALEARAVGKGLPETPRLAFAWAAIWMLREIEMRKMKLQDITFPGDNRWITIWLPTSKCDQEGRGIRRTLRCCGKSPCTPLCPWALGWKVVEVARAKGALPGSALFASWNNLKATSKSGNIKAWKAHLGEHVSGHSPRRSGAMYYVRAGLPIQELAFLGRWKSNVVLQYAEEALQEKAVLVPGLHNPDGTHVEDQLKDLPVLHRELDVAAPATPALTAMIPKPPQNEAIPGLLHSLQTPRDLWVVTKGRGWKNRPRHLVTKATWNLAMSCWTTACGWNFAVKSSDFYFVSGSVSDKLKCNKCCLLDRGATSQEGIDGRTGMQDMPADTNESAGEPVKPRKRRRQ